jgi:hypothetical protein
MGAPGGGWVERTKVYKQRKTGSVCITFGYVKASGRGSAEFMERWPWREPEGNNHPAETSEGSFRGFARSAEACRSGGKGKV